MDALIKLNNQTNGRDKLARLLQYMCRTLWDGINKTENTINIRNKLQSLEYTLSSFRKLLRFGKCLDVFYSALNSIHHPDLTLRFSLTFSKISHACYLLADHIIWLARSGLFKDINSVKWTRRANQYWLLAIIMNLVRDLYEINRVINMHTNYTQLIGAVTCNICSIRSSKEFSVFSSKVFTYLDMHKDIALDTLKNGCDFFIPFASLGFMKLSPRTVGLLGVISSMAGLLVILEPRAKLLPA